jgi:hypothetical protein
MSRCYATSRYNSKIAGATLTIRYPALPYAVNCLTRAVSHTLSIFRWPLDAIDDNERNLSARGFET